jgi:hypothetical protein
VGEQFRVEREAIGLVVIRIDMAIDHVVEPLEPRESGEFVALLRIVGRADRFGSASTFFTCSIIRR